jgi:HEAT repeat protein
MDCDPTSEANIYDVFLEDGDRPIQYKNLTHMLQIVVDAYLSRAYYIEDELLQENSVLLQKIKNKYLSQEQRDARESTWKTLSCEADRLLISQDWGRHYFMSRLSQFNDERAIDYLLEFLKDSDPEVIAHAAFGLGELKARETLPELMKLLKHPVEMVRNLSACAIADIASQKDKVLLQPLIELLTDEKTLVRIAAIEALGQLRNPKAVSPLIDLLQDSNTGVRYRVIQALAKTGDNGALEALRRWKSEASSDQEIQMIDQAISRMEKVNS